MKIAIFEAVIVLLIFHYNFLTSQAPPLHFLKTPSLFGDYRHLYLEQEVYFTYLCREKQICTQGNCIQDQNRPIYFSCKYFGLTLKPFQKAYLSHLWKVPRDMICDKTLCPLGSNCTL